MNGLEMILAALRERGAKVREVKPGQFMRRVSPTTTTRPVCPLRAATNCTPLIKCMAGCDTDDVLKALGLTWPMILGDNGQCAPSSSKGTAKTASKTYPDMIAPCARS